MPKKIILPIVIIFLLAGVVYQTFLKKEKSAFTLAEVTRGTITQEVSETGKVQKGEKLNLTFENSGEIEKIYVKVGDEVKEGDVLAELETSELEIKLQEAKSNLAVSQTKLDKLLAGASQEEIKVSQTKVENSQIALDVAKQNLKDVYEDALNTLDDVYLKSYNAKNTTESVQTTYFTSTDQQCTQVKENKNKIAAAVSQIRSYLDTAKADPTYGNIDLSLSEIKDELSSISAALKIIRENCEDPNYKNTVSSADKTSLDTHRTNINTAITNIISSQQSITSKDLAVKEAEGDLQTAKDNLALTVAPPREEDVNLYKAQVEQAKAQVRILENQIQKTVLKSPVSGQITEIKKRVGEMAQPTLQDVLITLLPLAPFEIETDIYEEDVVKMAIGNPVDISLVAFPNQILKGKVVTIDPAEKLIEGVVYYKVTIDFEEIPEGIKPGMTTDVVIKTASKENVLTVLQDAIQNKEGKTIVEVLKGEKFEEREIEIGLKGSNDIVEVISGLEEGEKVTIR